MPDGEPTGEVPQSIVPPTPAVGRAASQAETPQVITGPAAKTEQAGEAAPGRPAGDGTVVSGVGLTPEVAARLDDPPIIPEPSSGPPTGASMADLEQRLGGVPGDDSLGLMHAAQVGDSAAPQPPDIEQSGTVPPAAPPSSEPSANPPEPPSGQEPPAGTPTPQLPDAAPVAPKEGVGAGETPSSPRPDAAPISPEQGQRQEGATPPPPEQLTKDDTEAVVNAQKAPEPADPTKEQQAVDKLRADGRPNEADLQQERLNMQREAEHLANVEKLLDPNQPATPERDAQIRQLVGADEHTPQEVVDRRVRELRAQVPARRAELQEKQNAYNAHAKEMDNLAQEADKHNKKGETHQEGVEKAELQQLRDLANAEATAKFAESADPALVEKAIQMAHNPDDPLHANALLANAKDAQDLKLSSQAEKDYQERLRKEFDKKENRKDLRRAAGLADKAKKKGYSEVEGLFADRINQIHEKQKVEATIGLIKADKAKAARVLGIPEAEVDAAKTKLELRLGQLNESINDKNLEKKAKEVMKKKLKDYERELGEAWKHWRKNWKDNLRHPVKNWKANKELLKGVGKLLGAVLLRILIFLGILNLLAFVGTAAVGLWAANKALGGQGGH